MVLRSLDSASREMGKASHICEINPEITVAAVRKEVGGSSRMNEGDQLGGFCSGAFQPYR